MKVELVHFIPGRLRVKVPSFKGDPATMEEVRRRLSAEDGVNRVSVNPTVGTVLVVYEASEEEQAALFLRLAMALGLPASEVDLLRLREQMYTRNGDAASETPMSASVKEWASDLNTRTRNLAGGSGDLRDLFPLTLFMLGIRSLVVADSLTFPSWYEYFWFSLNAFFIFNKQPVVVPKHDETINSTNSPLDANSASATL